MRAFFADTFYWIALTAAGDAAYERAHEVTGDIVTIDEVLTEYLTFFAASRSTFVAKPRVSLSPLSAKALST